MHKTIKRIKGEKLFVKFFRDNSTIVFNNNITDGLFC